MHVRCYYYIPRPKLKDDGTVVVEAKDVSLSQTVSVRNDGSGHMVVSSGGCSFDVRKISVEFHGGARYCSMQSTFLALSVVTVHVSIE